MTETVWLTKPKAVNTVWQFTEKIYQLLYIDLWVRKDLSFLRVTSEELIKAMDSLSTSPPLQKKHIYKNR